MCNLVVVLSESETEEVVERKRGATNIHVKQCYKANKTKTKIFII